MNDTAFSLLKEARGQLAAMHDHLMELTAKLPMQYFGLVDGGLIQNAGNLIGRIDAYLASPAPDAMEVVDEIFGIYDEARYLVKILDGPSVDREATEIMHKADSEAAALIEASIEQRIKDLKADNKELNDIFSLQYTRMGEATELWRKAHPGNELVLPDLGELLAWLMEGKEGKCADKTKE